VTPSAAILCRCLAELGVTVAELAIVLDVRQGDVTSMARTGAPDTFAEPLNAMSELCEHVTGVYGRHAAAAMRDSYPELDDRSLTDVLVSQGPFAARDTAARLF
jgi:hypothetical protein